MVRTLLCLVAALALLVPLSGRVARAEEQLVAKGEMERAHQAYLDGEAAYRLGRFDEAVARYEEAYRIMKFPSMLFDVAQANRRWFDTDKNPEHLKKAVELYRTFLREAPGSKQAPVAEKLIPELERSLQTETSRRRQEMIDRAVGREGLFLVDQLVAENDAASAALVLDRILASHANPREVIVGGLERRGVVAALLGDQVTAIQSFKKALALDPAYLVPESSDKLTRDSFRLARDYLGSDARALAVTHTPPGDVPQGSPARVEVLIEFDKLALVKQVGVYYRRAGSGAYLLAKVDKSPGSVEVEIPSDYVSGKGGAEFEYYVAALDRVDGELALHGSAAAPFRFALQADPTEAAAERERNKPAWKKWPTWVITAGGVVLIGLVAGIAVGARSNENVLVPSLLDLRTSK